MSTDPTIGIVTGSGPDAGIDLWQKLLVARRAAGAYAGDADAPRVVVVSEPLLGRSMDLPTTDDIVWPALEATVRQLAPQVDRFAIACNTLNVYADRIIELGLDAEFVTYPNALRRWARDEGVERFALLAAQPVLALDEWSAYAGLATDFDVVVPDDGATLHALIEAIKRDGGANPAHRTALASIIEGTDCDVAVLACTELPLVAEPMANTTIVDVTDLVARQLLSPT